MLYKQCSNVDTLTVSNNGCDSIKYSVNKKYCILNSYVITRNKIYDLDFCNVFMHEIVLKI